MAINPYLKLCRLDKPTGIFLLLWPCWWGLALAESYNIKWYILFAIGAVIMRSAGCVINDIWDRDIDKQVARTKDRPLASGALTLENALFLLAGLLVVGFIILLQFPLKTILLGICSLPLVAVYPLMKRFFPVPQLFLGLVFNWGVLMGYQVGMGSLYPEAYWLYAAAIFWTLGYDTIYALQDIDDDQKIGVKSSALFFGRHTNIAILICYFNMFTLLMIASKDFGVMLILCLLLPLCKGELGHFRKRSASQLFVDNSFLGFVVFIMLLLPA